MQTTTKPKLLPVNRAAAHWAAITGTPRPHRSSLIRWATKGVRGIRLRGEHIAGRWYVSEQAIEEFLRSTTQLDEQCVDRAAGPARAAQVQRTHGQLDIEIASKRPGRKAK